MDKLLKAYIADQTNENARKVAAHAVKHPMASCMLSPAEHGWLRQARTQAA